MSDNRHSPNGKLAFDQLSSNEKDTVLTAIRRGASRRDVLKMFGTMGITAAAGGLMVGAAQEVHAATPKKGGKLTIAHDQHGPADTMDPQLYTATIDYARGRMFYGSLTRMNAKLEAGPELAEEFMANADATQWTFKLRKGVQFHDGSTMTADDVIWTMNRHLGKDSKSKATSLVQMITEWKKVNDYEIVAVMDSPNADLPAILATFHFKILKKDTTDFSTGNGTGPFRVKEFKPGVRSIATPFENYWGDGPYVDEIEYFGIGDSVARTNAFLNGDINIVGNVPPKSIKQVESTGNVIHAVESGAYINIAARTDMAPGNDPHLVLALKYLMDRTRVLKGVLKGYGGVGNDHPIGPAYGNLHCADVPQRTLDADKAKYHLSKSKHKSIEIHAAEVAPGAVEQVLILQREAKKIGLDVKVKKVTTDGYWGAVWLKVPVCVVSWNMRPTANVMLTLTLKSDAPWNESYWKNEKFDQLLLASRAELDPVKNKQMYCDMQTMVSETGGTILPVHRSYVDAMSSKIRGMGRVPLGNFGASEFPEYVWIDS
jgi:peptide/nickel transport system substrate-binding protein